MTYYRWVREYKTAKNERNRGDRYFNSIKKISVCYVCGKNIPLFGGRLVHNGICKKVYCYARNAYFHRKHKIDLPIDKTIQ